MEDWTYRSTFSWPRHQLEVSGQLHAPAALPQWNNPRYSSDRRLSGPQHGGKKFLTLPGLELRPLSRLVCNKSLYRLRYSGRFVNKELERTWKSRSWPNSGTFHQFTWRDREENGDLSHNRRRPGIDSKRGSHALTFIVLAPHHPARYRYLLLLTKERAHAWNAFSSAELLKVTYVLARCVIHSAEAVINNYKSCKNLPTKT
jgi:hypothetical protein